MAVNLSKGQSVSLSKDGGGGIESLHVGLGWDPVQASEKKGFFGKLLGGGGGDIDLDASCIACDAQGNAIDLVWFQQLDSKDGAIHHTGDNLTGEGDGDDEVIHVSTSRLNTSIQHLVFTVNSFRGQTFNEIENAVCRVLDRKTNTELVRFTLAEQGAHTGVVMGVLSRSGSGWTFKALGTVANGRTAKDMSAAAQAAVAAV